MFIGKRIRELRKARKMTLTEMAERSKVQIATLSRIEHEKMTGTLESHMAVAQALGVDITALYQNLSAPTPPALLEPPADAFTYNEGASYEILTSRVLSKKMMPVMLKIDPDGQTTPEQNPPGAEKFLFVLEGKVSVHVGEQTVELGPKQTLYFDAHLKHHFTNTGKKTARLIAVTTPVNL